jgi:hypothetical protein
VSTVVGDRYGGEFPREVFRKFGMTYQVADRPRSDLYRDALPLFNSGRVELLDHARLGAQLACLERRTSRSGRDSIAEPAGQHDDVANAACGAIVLAGQASARGGWSMFNFMTGQMITGTDSAGNVWRDYQLVTPAGGCPDPGPVVPQPTTPGIPIPTVKVCNGAGFAIINRDDFNPSIHTLWREPDPEPAPSPAADAATVPLMR